MRRSTLLVIPLVALALAALPAASLAASSRTTTAVRVKRPSPGNATVAGFELRLLPTQTAAPARAVASAVRLPKGITVEAVLAKQKRSDRVRGVLVVLDRADAVAARAARGSVLTVKLRHAAIPTGFRATLTVKQRRNVLGPGHAFRCSSYFRASDLGAALSLGGPALPGLAIRDAIADACAAAGSRAPYVGENEFLGALNARSGFLTFVRDRQVPTQLDGSAAFNYPVAGFAVLADKEHSFTGCASPVASCRLLSKGRPNDYAVFTLASSPAPSNMPFAFTLGMNAAPRRAMPFEFFGKTQAGARFGPLLTSGP